MPLTSARLTWISLLLTLGPRVATAADLGPDLALAWAHNLLTIRGADLPGDTLKVWYLEAFCRGGSTDREWKETVIPHSTRLIEADLDGRRITLRSTLADGVIVDHEIRAGRD